MADNVAPVVTAAAFQALSDKIIHLEALQKVRNTARTTENFTTAATLAKLLEDSKANAAFTRSLPRSLNRDHVNECTLDALSSLYNLHLLLQEGQLEIDLPQELLSVMSTLCFYGCGGTKLAAHVASDGRGRATKGEGYVGGRAT